MNNVVLPRSGTFTMSPEQASGFLDELAKLIDLNYCSVHWDGNDTLTVTLLSRGRAMSDKGKLTTHIVELERAATDVLESKGVIGSTQEARDKLVALQELVTGGGRE